MKRVANCALIEMSLKSAPNGRIGKSRFGSHKGLVPNRQQAIIRDNDYFADAYMCLTPQWVPTSHDSYGFGHVRYKECNLRVTNIVCKIVLCFIVMQRMSVAVGFAVIVFLHVVCCRAMALVSYLMQLVYLSRH